MALAKAYFLFICLRTTIVAATHLPANHFAVLGNSNSFGNNVFHDIGMKHIIAKRLKKRKFLQRGFLFFRRDAF